MNLFELFVKIGVDDQASDKISDLSSKLGNGLKTAAKIGTAAVGAAAAGITALTTAAVNNYAEYEQLVGGVETLFKQSSDVVQQYAANAYKTAGMSANEYMETVTSFSASLLQSLDGDTNAAAEKANLAITDMSDNANKMGTSMEMIQNAYQGFAKQNYTMLDNLKLGYGGTKEEMQRLLKDAEKLSGQKFDLSSYADIVDAIHVVQTEMGITGTTAKEASSTISGSIASMKSAWSNLVTGIADENADLDMLIGNFVDSVATAGENIIPRVEQILGGIGTAITKLAPIISAAIPSLVTNVLPTLLDAGVQLINGLLQGLISALPSLATSAVSVIETLATAIIEQLPALITAAAEVIVTLAIGISEALPELIPTIVEVIIQIVETIIDNVDMLVDAAIEIIMALAEGLINSLPILIEKVPEIIAKLVNAVVTNAPKLLSAALELIVMLAKGLITNIPELVKAIPQIITSIVEGFASLMSSIIDIGKDIVNGIWKGIQSMASWIKDKVTGFFSGIVDGVKDFLGIHSPSRVFSDMGKNMALGIGEGWDSEYNRIKKNIERGMDFGTTNVDFAYSGVGVASAGMINGISSSIQSGQTGGSFTFNLILPSGEKLASYTFRPMADYAKANGTPILNPT